MPDNNPLSSLLKADNERTAAAHALADALDELTAAIAAYRERWAGATRAGWATTDLKRASFLDPARLPRVSARQAARDTKDGE